MKNAFVAAAAGLCACLAGPALAQAPIVHLPDRASPRQTLDAQLSELSDRIDRYVSQKRLSPADTDHARRELNRLQGAVSDARERNGGRMEVADRFELRSQIEKLREEIRRQRTSSQGVAEAPRTTNPR